VVGIGLNTTLREHELPRPDATSLALAGAASADRDPLLRALLRSFEEVYARWQSGDDEGIREAYLFHCGTIGRRVRVELPAGTALTGVATGIDVDGRLQVTDPAEAVHTVAAGDVVHVRPEPSG
jgi:BirA family biotin operon repressor/biotin-[acetyl-CoA-carboxylase] ligase